MKRKYVITHPNQIFIKEYLKSGDGIGAYHKAYPKTKRNIASNGSKRLLRIKEIAAIIAERQAIEKEIYERGRADEIKRMAAEDVASEHEIKSVLTKMIRKKGVAAKVEIIKNKKGDQVGTKQEVLYPSFQQQIYAAKTLNEMMGYEAPKENKVVVTVQEIPELTPEDRKKFKDEFDSKY